MPAQTELEQFNSWLDRECVPYDVELDMLGTDVIVRDPYTEARISFRADGTFSGVTSGE